MKTCMALVLSAVVCAAQAQEAYEWHIEVSNHISPANPRATISVLAGFPATEYAFAGALFQLRATEPGWSDPRVLLPPPRNPGVINGANITGITAGQIHFPPVVIGDPTNPLPVFEAEWHTNDFTPRWVDVNTFTTRYDVYPSALNSTAEWRFHLLIEGHARIRIVPAPSALALLGLAAVTRRRRPRSERLRPCGFMPTKRDCKMT